MKQFSKFAAIFCFMLVFAFFPAIVVQAAPSVAPAFQEPSVPNLDDLLVTLKNLGGVALLIAALTNAAKQFGWITDSQAPAASLALNTLALVGLVALQLTGKADTVPGLDQNAGALATAINAVLALVFQLYVARKGHENVLAGLPVIGKSFTGRRA
jgi:hypothetical protein